MLNNNSLNKKMLNNKMKMFDNNSNVNSWGWAVFFNFKNN